ncbi:MAG: DUF2341 domain-containing protein [Candidatus Thorarchaeota archaeon]
MNRKAIQKTIPKLTKDSTNLLNNTTSVRLKRSNYFVPGWADTRWEFRKNITIQSSKVLADLANFPVLVNLYDPDLQQDAQASGNDIMFSDNSGNILDHEIESYERVYNRTHSHLVAWVKMNLSSTQNTIVSMYYGNPAAAAQENPTAVWEENYVGVWHLGEKSGNARDSTSFATSGNLNGGVTQGNLGQIGYAYDFDGNSGTTVSAGDPIDGHLDFGTGNFTVSTWINIEYTGTFQMPLYKGGTSSGNQGYTLEINSGQSAAFYVCDGDNDGTTADGGAAAGWPTIPYGSWTYLVGVANRLDNNIRIYKNGLFISAQNFDFVDSVDTANSLVFSNSFYPVNGTIDEPRVSNEIHSLEWIQTEYNNQKDPSTFYSIGTEEEYVGEGEWAIPMLKFRKNVTILASQVSGSGTLVNFPVLLDLYDTDLHSTDKVQVDGDDIAFADVLGTKLDHEIELFNQTYTSTHARLIAWIKVPNLSGTSNTTISMYYGNAALGPQQNPEGVWDSNYAGVWHLSEANGGSLAIKDSTSNYNHGTDYGTVELGASGQIYGSVGFNAFEDFVSIADSPSLDITQNLTISVWTKADYFQWSLPVLAKDEAPNSPYAIWYINNSNQITYNLEGVTTSSVDSGVTVNREVWLYVVLTYDGSYVEIYTNGTSIYSASKPGTITPNNQPLQFGREQYWGDTYRGYMDEIRISNFKRSANWIATEYNNQYDPNSFYIIREEEEFGFWFRDASFDYKKDILVNNTKVFQNLIDFPVLVDITDSALKTGRVQPDADDILFISADGTKLAHEIDSFTQTSIEGHLVAWVNLPEVFNTEDTPFSMYYGNNELPKQENPEQVWPSKYLAVHHMDESPVVASSSSIIFRPNSIGTYTELTSSPAGNNWAMVDEENPDEDSTHVQWSTSSSSTQRRIDSYNFMDPINGLGRIDKVTIYVRASVDSIPMGTPKVRTFIRSYSTNYFGTDTSLTTAYQNYFTEYTESPYTGTTWTWEELNNLEIGVELGSSYSMVTKATQVWIKISYTPASVFDSTDNDADLSTVGSMSTADIVDAQISKGIDFDGIDDGLISVSTVTTTSFTISAWIKLEAVNPSYRSIVSIGEENGVDFRYMGLLDRVFIIDGGITYSFGSALTVGEWYYVMSSYNGANVRGIVNSQNQGSNSTSWGEISRNFLIGIWGDSGFYSDFFDGVIDEVRISNVPHSGGWIMTEYQNQLNPTSFYSIGPEIVIDKNPPVINDFGIDDPGKGVGKFWADVTDSTTNVKSVTIKINGTEYGMNFNGTHWTYQKSVTFLSSYEYQIVNASDYWNNYLQSPSGIKNHTFSIDTTDPNVDDWEYYPDTGEYGTFKTNVSDTWGVVDTVIVNVTEGTVPQGKRWAVMQSTPAGYINDTIIMDSGSIKFVITVNDTSGNSVTSGVHQGYVPIINHFPLAENLTLSRDSGSVLLPVYSNSTLYLDYDFYDKDGDSEGGTEIRWYKNGILQTAYNDIKQIPASALFKSDSWNATVKPKDGQEFGILNDTETVTVQNTAPTVFNAVISPVNPVTTSILSVNYNFNDYDGDSENIGNRQIYWYKDGVLQVNLNDSAFITSGNTTKNQQWHYEIKVNDGINNSNWMSSSSVIIYNSIPLVSNLAISPSNPKTDHNLIASYDYSDPNGDLESGTYIRWFKNGIEQSSYENQTTVPSSVTTKGENWYFTIRPSDGEDYGNQQQSAAVTIINTAPIVANLNITSSAPKTGENFEAFYDFSDNDSDLEIGSQIIWYKNGILQGVLNDTKIISSSYSAKGEEWHYKIKPSDGTDYGQWYSCLTNITIANTAPIASNLIITPNSPKTGDSLIASYDFSDIDSDSQSGSRIIWYKDGVLQGALNDSISVTSSSTNKGEKWHFKVRPNDGEDYGNWVSLGTNVTIGNTIPVANNLNLSPSSPVTGEDLVANYDYSDVDGDPEGLTEIRWYKNGVLQSNLNNSLMIQSGNTSKGEIWYFTIKPNDGGDFGILQQSSTVTVGNTPPTASSTTLLPGNPKTSDNLNVNYVYSDADADTESGTLIIWYKDGILQGALNNSNIVDSSYTTRGEEWHCKVRPSDGTVYGNWVESIVNATIGNSAPIASNVDILPGNPTTSDGLIISYTWTDADIGDLESGTQIRWYKNGVLQPELNNTMVIGSGNTTRSDEWHCRVHPSDGLDYGNWIPSLNNVTIGNTAPQVNSAKINESSPVADNSDLHVSYVYSDFDNDPQDNGSREIRWYKDGILVTSLNDSMIVGEGNTTVGDIWYFTIRVSDGYDHSSLQTSPSVSIQSIPNQIPVASNLNFTNSNPTTSDYLYINYTYSDGDGDPESGSMYYWYRNGIHLSQYDGLRNLSASSTLKGEQWHVKVQPRDGKDFGTVIGVSVNVTIGNTPPSAAGLEITPLNALTGNDLLASYIFSDTDSDIETGSEIIWYLDGVLQGALNGSSTIKAGNTTKGDVWHFKVHPKDGTDFGNWVSCPVNVTIGNTQPSTNNLAVTPNNAKTGDNLIASYDYFDVDGDLESGSYIRWFRNGLEEAAFENQTMVPGINTSKGQTWYFILIPKDGSNYGPERTSAAVTILNSAPSANNLAISPFNPQTTEPLTATYDWLDPDNATDSNSGSLIIWYKNGVLQGALNNSMTVDSGYTSKGDIWHFKVLPKDGVEFGNWASCLSNITVMNSAPVISDISITPTDPKTANDLSVVYTYTDVNSDPESGSDIIWYKDGVLQGILNNSQIVQAGNTTKGEVWHVKIRPSDGADFGNWVDSLSNITILNTKPSVNNLVISPSTPKTTDNLMLNYDYSDLDTDLEGMSYIRWYKNDIEQISLRNQTTVFSSEIAKGQSWYVTILPHDGTEYGILKISLSTTIGNTGPSANSLVFSPTIPKGGNILSVTYSYSDADSDLESGTIIRWYRNNVFLPSYNDKMVIDSGLIVKGDLWNVSIRVADGTEFGNWLNASVSITNSAPSVVSFTPEIYVPPTGIFTTNTLLAMWDDWDPDGDNITDYIIIWYQNLNPVPQLENLTQISSNFTTKNDNWRFYVNVFDGEDWSDPLGNPILWKYGTTTIANSEPFADNITLTGGSTTTDDVFLSYDFFDADGDPENSKIEWKIVHQGSVKTIEGITTLSNVEFTAGDLIWVVITPDDNDGGMLTGQPVDSSTLSGSNVIKLIGNTAPEINTTQGLPSILADHPYGTNVFTGIYPIYLNYSSLVVDIDSGESDFSFDVDFQLNPAVQYAAVTENIGAQYRWYKFNGTSSRWELQIELTSSVVNGYYLNKGERWMASIRPRDNYGFFGSWVNTSSIIIGNSYPEVHGFTWLTPKPTTSDDLQFLFDYFDWDGDPLDMTRTIFLWLKNGQIISGTENTSILSSQYFVKGDEIIVIIRPYDGTNWATGNFTSTSIFIVNSKPEITDIKLFPAVIDGANVLYLNWSYFDVDNDPEDSSHKINWFRNGENQSIWANSVMIPSGYLSNDDLWQAQLWVYDGSNYSIVAQIQIPVKVLSAQFSFDTQTSLVDPDIRVNEFLVEDENITVSFYFSEGNDAQDSRIQWFKLINGSWIEQASYENRTIICANDTVAGDQWYFTVTPYDRYTGFIWFQVTSNIISIESRPKMLNQAEEILVPLNDTEGHYQFNILTFDQLNDVIAVELLFNDSLVEIADKSSFNKDLWIAVLEISPDQLSMSLNKDLNVRIKIISSVNYFGNQFEIYSLYHFNFTVRDEVAPRVIDPYWVFDDNQNPTNLTFITGILEYGSNISEVLLYYYFKPVNASGNGGNGASMYQNGDYSYRMVEMAYHNTSIDGIPTYQVVVPFDHNGTSREIIYYIVTTDSTGNSIVAFDVLRDDPNSIQATAFTYNPPGVALPIVIVVILVTVIAAIFGSLVYVKFIRKPELVGLDKELVMSTLSEVNDREIGNSLDEHTIGVVISFFDQRHGPIPIIVEPEILRDNFAKLVDLSDRSFSGTGFCDTFNTEITSSYDFVLAHGTRAKVMSFGYALERPGARGGKEDLTANILIHQEFFPLVNQFLIKIQQQVKILHKLMNEDTDKTKVINKVRKLRSYVSQIIISYEKIYGDAAEFVEEEL